MLPVWINPFSDVFYTQPVHSSELRLVRQATESLPMTASSNKSTGKPLHMNVVNVSRYKNGPLPALAPAGVDKSVMGKPPKTAPAPSVREGKISTQQAGDAAPRRYELLFAVSKRYNSIFLIIYDYL